MHLTSHYPSPHGRLNPVHVRPLGSWCREKRQRVPWGGVLVFGRKPAYPGACCFGGAVRWRRQVWCTYGQQQLITSQHRRADLDDVMILRRHCAMLDRSARSHSHTPLAAHSTHSQCSVARLGRPQTSRILRSQDQRISRHLGLWLRVIRVSRLASFRFMIMSCSVVDLDVKSAKVSVV